MCYILLVNSNNNLIETNNTLNNRYFSIKQYNLMQQNNPILFKQIILYKIIFFFSKTNISQTDILNVKKRFSLYRKRIIYCISKLI